MPHLLSLMGEDVATVMQRDPLPGLGDSGYEYELRQLAKISQAVLLRAWCPSGGLRTQEAQLGAPYGNGSQFLTREACQAESPES